MSDGISESGKVNFLPGDNESPSACNETFSDKEGRQNDATASVSKGMEGRTGTEGNICNAGIEGSCKLLEVSIEKVGSISSASICFSRLELTREYHTSESNLPLE